MSRLRVAPIVEGHGEVVAVRTLFERIWYELLEGQFIEVLQPVRQPRTRLLTMPAGATNTEANAEQIARAVKLAAAKLHAAPGRVDRSLILILLDANSDCPRHLAPKIRQAARDSVFDQEVAIVLANVEYETWFVAAAESLRDHLRLDEGAPADPEEQRCGKKWIQNRFLGARYSETVDQVRLTARLDLRMCRERSPSFDKLCRELEARLL